MKHPIYIELRTLTDNPNHIAAIKTAAVNGTPETLRKAMCRAVSIAPAIPSGKRYAKECFWAKFQSKFIWHTAWMGPESRKDSAARWLRAMREAAQRRGQAWPPEPIFIPQATTPAPWDGRNEKPGRVPRDGKE